MFQEQQNIQQQDINNTNTPGIFGGKGRELLILAASALVLALLAGTIWYFFLREETCQDQNGASCSGESEESLTKRQINIVFDIHSHADFFTEAFGGSPSLEMNRRIFQSQLDDLEWLLDLTDQYGAKISFLSVAPWAELCLDDVNHNNKCFSIINELYQSGGLIGFHSHNYEYLGSLNKWAQAETYRMSSEEIKQLLEENIDFVKQLIERALGITGESGIMNAMLAYGSDLPKDTVEKHELIEELGFLMKEGGEEKELVRYFNHPPFNPFRPGASRTSEDLNAKILNIPQYGIYTTENGMCTWTNGIEECLTKHLGIEGLDVGINHQKAMFLELYLNWMLSKDDKVWAYGWGSHVHDWEAKDTGNRQRLQDMLQWLSDNFVSKGIAKFSNYRGVLEEYEEWEVENPGVSSFNYPLEYTDYNAYPYYEWVNKYLRNSVVKEEISAKEGISAYSMLSGDYQFILAFSDKTTDTDLDLSNFFSEQNIQRVFLETGDTDTLNPSSITLDQRPVVFCTPSDCQAIIDQEGPTPQPDGKCGDGTCQGPETSQNCPKDCSGAAPSPPQLPGGECGDGVCAGPEDATKCPADCQ